MVEAIAGQTDNRRHDDGDAVSSASLYTGILSETKTHGPSVERTRLISRHVSPWNVQLGSHGLTIPKQELSLGKPTNYCFMRLLPVESEDVVPFFFFSKRAGCSEEGNLDS